MSDVPVPEPEASLVRRTVDEVRRNNRWATRLEVALVIIVCLVNLVFVAFVGWNTRQARELSKSNRAVLDRVEQGNDVGIKAVQCVLDNFALHRNTNQDVHDAIAKALKVPPTPHTPLPDAPSDDKISADCAPFLATRR